MFLDPLASRLQLGELEYHMYVKNEHIQTRTDEQPALGRLLKFQNIQPYKLFHLDVKDFFNTLLDSEPTFELPLDLSHV